MGNDLSRKSNAGLGWSLIRHGLDATLRSFGSGSAVGCDSGVGSK
ncbi:hypothetical protein ACQPW3_25190 [Actinosynnema sp. CA-248983]